MSRKYKFHNPDGAYLISFSVVDWINVFTRNEYREIIIDSLNWCVKNKGLEIFAWCLLSNHIHLVARRNRELSLPEILRDFKKHTAKKLIAAIKEHPQESRKEWMLTMFEKHGNECSNVRKYQFWRHDNHPVEIWSNGVIRQKVTYIHNNPVEEGLVIRPEDYPFSSARDYSGEKGLVELVLVDLF